jgi:Rad3-related DNA helicase/DNA polymerase III epsilon subunit-like protein
MTDPATVEAALARASLPSAEALEALTAALGPLSVVDFETTGLEPYEARVIEIGVVRVLPGEGAALLHSLVDPEMPLPPAIRQLTGIEDGHLAGRPRWRELRDEVGRFVAGTAIVAHNAAFERVLLTGVVPPEATFLDTLELACILRPELESHSLASLAEGLLGRTERHRALDDALDTLAVLAILHAGARRGEHVDLNPALAGLRRAWGWSPLLAAPPAGYASDRVGRREDPWEGRVARVRARRNRLELPDASPDAVAGLLADEERWRRVAPEYRARPEQIELARAIATAFHEGRAAAVEAGTGVGKTLAYCLVGLLQAIRTGERVVITSANRTLQERVVRVELPRVAAALGIEAPEALVLKGRINYGNPLRVRQVSEHPEEMGLGDLSPAARLYTASFLSRCAERDLQSFGGWLLHNDPSLREVRDRIACQPECDERACRSARFGPCSYLRHVDALAHAALVSINHSLLLRWPARYGAIPHLIVDEAHELAAEADRAFSEEVRSGEIRGWLARLSERRRAGLVAVLGLRAGDLAASSRIAELARRAEEDTEEVGRALFDAAGEHPAAVPREDDSARDRAWGRAAQELGVLAGRLCELGERLDGLAAASRSPAATEDDALVADAAALALALTSAGRGLLADAFAQSREDTVYAARAWRRRDQDHDWWIRATPLETAERVHARLFAPAQTVVALSATLGVGGDPGPTLEKIGWNLIEPERRLPTQIVASPFDYARNSVLAFVHEGTYRDEGFHARCAQSVAAIARLLGGRTMALFTNANRLENVANRVEPLLAPHGLATLVQRRGVTPARLVGQFLADPRAVLLGTRSLWQGIDIPGEALSCVVVDKLPFPPPDDPLVQGRAQRIRERGGDEFRALALEPAVVAFKQMFGRLIRTETDRGFVVVLGADPTRSYVSDFVASLPGPPRLVVGSLAEILDEMREFFR